MTFVHGHARDTGWVVSHYRRPQRAGDDQLDLEVPATRREDDRRAGGATSEAGPRADAEGPHPG